MTRRRLRRSRRAREYKFLPHPFLQSFCCASRLVFVGIAERPGILADGVATGGANLPPPLLTSLVSDREGAVDRDDSRVFSEST